MDSLANVYGLELLKHDDISQVLIYQTGCIGCEIIDDCDCQNKSKISILLWQDSGRSYMKRIDCCGMQTNELTDLKGIWRELKGNKRQIFKSEFKWDIEEVHHSFYEIQLLEDNSIQKIQMADYYFNDYNKYQSWNSKQAARKFQLLIQSILD